MPFSLKTLNGRFVWGIITFLIFLIGLSVYSHKSVRQSASSSLEYIRKNQVLTEKLNSLTALVEAIESDLHQYSTFMRDDLPDDLLGKSKALEKQAMSLRSETDLLATKSLSDAGDQLVNESRNLQHIIRKYINIMQDIKSRFPAMPILLTQLEPSNRRFSEAVEQALQEGELTEFDPKIVKADQFRIMQLFERARYSWAMQISWFRMFVANRMGAFGDPKTAMQNNLANRDLFALSVANIIKQLETFDRQGKLSIQQEASLHQMKDAMSRYSQYLAKAVAIYSSNNWRADVALVRDELQPTLERYWENLHQMERGIAETNKAGLSKSQNTARLLSWFIWLFTSTISLMLFIAYYIFQRKIRMPVIQLAESMQTGPAIDQKLPCAEGNLEEINRLIGSYSEMRQQVHHRQLRLQSILDNAAEGIITIDDEYFIENFNKAASRLFQYDTTEAIGRNFSVLFPDKALPTQVTISEPDNNMFETVGQKKDGSQFYMSIKLSEMKIGDQTLHTAIVEDISERRAVMSHLRELAEHDSLTRLYNRQYFNDELERIFAQAQRQPRYSFSCLYIDLDNFKFVNDTLGHLEGDRLLSGIADTLKSRTRKADILARLGGDEFALILHNIDRAKAASVAETYRQAISDYIFSSNGKHINPGCSIGVALYEPEIMSKDELLSRADIACHMAKRAGRNRIHIFEEADKNNVNNFHKEMGWARRIRCALENNDFIFDCQPMLCLKNDEIFSHELLLRMCDSETDKYLLPGGFLSAAERFGLMPEIDRWVIEHAFNKLSSHDQSVNGHHSYFINISGKSIGDARLLEHIKQLLPKLGIAPERIVFEITENVAIAELQHAKHFLKELRGFGFKTALDDFGVGYSSFSYLRELDVDFVKIDGSFIRSMHTDELNLALVKAINDICHILGKKTVAEYVENEFALKLLKAVGVDYAQGYKINELAKDHVQNLQLRVG